jgi:hypothetical protein
VNAPIIIPPELLGLLGREQGLTQAILVGWMPSGMTHVVTWGDSLIDSAQAAQGGNFVRRALGFPETLCRELSPRVAEVLADAEARPSSPEEWVCITCKERNVMHSDADRCCIQCGMDLEERGELLRFLLCPPAGGGV